MNGNWQIEFWSAAWAKPEWQRSLFNPDRGSLLTLEDAMHWLKRAHDEADSKSNRIHRAYNIETGDFIMGDIL